MRRALALLAVLLLPALAAAQAVDVRAEFLSLHEARDDAGLKELWRAHPGRILVTIDADLEEGLALWEKGEADGSATEAVVAEHYARALWGARLASEATGRPIFVDYASAFVGWTDEQKRSFRAGQQAFGRARQAFGEGEHEDAVEAGRECTELALPLGDWWGTAMGLSIEASALLAAGEADGAVTAAGRARLIYHQLGLVGSERAALDTLVEALVTLKRWPRARVSAEAGLALARTMNDEEAIARLEQHLDTIAAALGED